MCGMGAPNSCVVGLDPNSWTKSCHSLVQPWLLGGTLKLGGRRGACVLYSYNVFLWPQTSSKIRFGCNWFRSNFESSAFADNESLHTRVSKLLRPHMFPNL